MTIAAPAARRPQGIINVGGDIPAQVEFWRSAARYRGFVGGVGSGKTFAGVIEILRMPPGSRGIVVAPTYGMMRDASQATFFEIVPPGLIASHHKQEQHTILTNGTEIFWRSADKPRSLRGPNLNWGYGDEWAFATLEAHRIVLGRIRRAPGRFFFTTTPHGRNWLYEWCMRDEAGVELIKASTKSNPHLLPSFYADLQKQYADDPAFAAQELEGEFVDLTGSKRVPGAALVRAFARRTKLTPPLLQPITCKVDGRPVSFSLPAKGARFYLAPEQGRRYVIGVDPAEGIPTGDDSALVVLDVGSGEVAAVVAGAFEPQEECGAVVALLSRYYGGAPALIERNNHGHSVIATARRHNVRCLKGDDRRPGWLTSPASKAQMWNEAAHNLTAAADPTLFDERLKNQIGDINRLTLKATGKGRGAVKVDDEATAYALAQVGRRLATGLTARNPDLMRKMLKGA
jgi:phage terminase large subunit-like protein